MKNRTISIAAVLTSMTVNVSADTIFSDDFQDANHNEWSVSQLGTDLTTHYAGNYSLRLTHYRNALQTISTAGFADVNIALQASASSLEGAERCVGEVSADGGVTWNNILSVLNGQDDGVSMYTGSLSNAVLDDNAALQLRIRSWGDNNYDYCWFDNIAVTGTPSSTVYDSLSGDGSVTRTAASYSALNGNTFSLTDYSAFAVPAGAANPTNTFQGTLTLNGEGQNGSFEEQGTNTASAYTDPGHLPEFSYQFVQEGTHLIPVDRGLIATSHLSWSYFLEPGRVWQENGDNGYSRAAIPFALQENGANCTYNGVLTFVFNDAGAISNVAYQIAGETCATFQYNMWGILDATYTQATVAGAAALVTEYQDEVARRMPVKPLAELAVDYPGARLNLSIIGSEQTASDMTAFGVAIDGTHYTGGCETRMGTYPYCDVMDLPSYSTAKSVFGGVGLMRMEQKYAGSQQDMIVSNWMSQCSGSQWTDVTLEDALDMATGNYDSAGYEVDEGSVGMRDDFFLKYTHAEKAAFSCGYERKVQPGTEWVYHTTDTYILGSAMDAYFRSQEGAAKDIYSDMLVEELWKPLGLSPVTHTTLRTFDAQAQGFAGYGLTFHRDDIVKLAEFFSKDNGKIDGQQMLDVAMLDAAMQRNSDRGLEAGNSASKYQNSFWAWNGKSTLGCTNDSWIPYLSGYGGIAAVMLPSDIVYYFFSDNNEHLFDQTAKELNKIRSACK